MMGGGSGREGGWIVNLNFGVKRRWQKGRSMKEAVVQLRSYIKISVCGDKHGKK
jgi:hypothetical protein